MNPLLIAGAAGAALLLLIKRGEGKKDTGGGATKPPPVSTGTKPKTDTEYLIGDTVGVVGGAAGLIGGGLASLGGGSVTGGLQVVGGTLAGVGSTLGLAIVPLSIVVILVIAGVVGARTAEAKSMARMWINYLPNARIMCGYEQVRIERFAVSNNTVIAKTRTVTDPRLEASFTADGQRYTYIGERAEWTKTDSAPNAVSWVEIQKAVRGAALVYTFTCGKYANALLRNWGPKIGNGGHKALEPESFYRASMYNDLAGYEGENLGGLDNVPLPDGKTESVRGVGINPPAAQLRAFDAKPIAEIAALAPEARLIAFKNVLQTIHFDNAVYFPFDPKRYAMDVYNRMELEPTYYVLSGTVIIMPFTAWGFRNDSGQPVNINVDVIAVKDNGPMANWYQTLA